MKLYVAFLLMFIVMDMFCPSSGLWGRSCTTPVTSYEAWTNHWDSRFTFYCPTGQAMNYIRSLYSTCKRDRVFKFKCEGTSVTRALNKCSWSSYVNNWDQPIHYNCPNHGYLTGISSYHHDSYEDRRFQFRCCYNSNRYTSRYCSRSGYVNYMRQSPFTYTTPSTYFMVGVSSYHNNHYEDRRWNFEYCKA